MTPAGGGGMLTVFEDREGRPGTVQLSQRLIRTGGVLGSLLQASTKKAATSLKVKTAAESLQSGAAQLGVCTLRICIAPDFAIACIITHEDGAHAVSSAHKQSM